MNKSINITEPSGLRLQPEQHRRFILFSPPGSGSVHFIGDACPGSYKFSSWDEVDFENSSGFLYTPFSFRHGPGFFMGGTPEIISDLEFDEILLYITEKLHPAPDHLPESQEDYTENLNSFLNRSDRELKKIVLFRTHMERVANSGQLIHFIQSVFKEHIRQFCTLFFDRAGYLWIGASPELLLKIDDNCELSTYALAGTTLKEDGKDWTDKEFDEADYVCRHIEEVYSRHSLEVNQSVNYTDYTQGNIRHLLKIYKSPSVSGSEISELISDLHPTPAIGGYPVQKALNALEGFGIEKREFYSGVFGLVNSGRCMLNINLRCAKIFSNQVIFFGGGGVTDASKAEQEWLETENKISILKCLFPAEG